MLKVVYKIVVAFGVFLLVGCNASDTNGQKQYMFEGNSMEPTIYHGDTVTVDINYYQENKIETGDIVLIDFDDNHHHIKRVVGLPGELIQISHGELLVDGKPIDSQFVFSEINSDEDMQQGVKLGKDEYFVIGDNAANPYGSKDSRSTGPIHKTKILGKIIEVE